MKKSGNRREGGRKRNGSGRIDDQGPAGRVKGFSYTSLSVSRR